MEKKDKMGDKTLTYPKSKQRSGPLAAHAVPGLYSTDETRGDFESSDRVRQEKSEGRSSRRLDSYLRNTRRVQVVLIQVLSRQGLRLNQRKCVPVALAFIITPQNDGKHVSTGCVHGWRMLCLWSVPM